MEPHGQALGPSSNARMGRHLSSNVGTHSFTAKAVVFCIRDKKRLEPHFFLNFFHISFSGKTCSKSIISIS